MKAYGDAGLITLAKAAGYRGKTITSLVRLKILDVPTYFYYRHEAFYNYFLSLYLSDSEHLEEGVYVSQIQCIMIVFLQRFTNADDEEKFRSEVQTKLSQPSYESIDRFMKAFSQKQDTIKFWYSYITEDCFAYITLYVATRYRNWNLRTAGIKNMVAIFAAFDCPTYQQLIPRHLHDLATLPTHLLNHLEKGAFAVRLSESDCRAEALDECHEMCINKN